MKISLIIIALMTFSFTGHSQAENNEPFCKIIVHYSNTPPLLEYLFSKYGIEDSERITMNIQNYEREHNVSVLDDRSYLEFIANIDNQLLGQTDPTKIAIIEAEKLKVINILTIETIVSQ
jgi:hypothetical protein